MASKMTTLHHAFVEQQRKRLQALRAQLLVPELRRDERDRGYQAEHGGEAKTSEDDAQHATESEVAEALHDLDERRIRTIERALQKIDEGTYGLSDASGEPIPKARLEVVPEAVLTVQEEEQAEHQDGRRR
jgi:DnaK suppressor protein